MRSTAGQVSQKEGASKRQFVLFVGRSVGRSSVGQTATNDWVDLPGWQAASPTMRRLFSFRFFFCLAACLGHRTSLGNEQLTDRPTDRPTDRRRRKERRGPTDGRGRTDGRTDEQTAKRKDAPAAASLISSNSIVMESI